MRVLALAALLGALPAAAHPIDDWLAAADDAEVVVIIPRLEALTAPLASALRQATELPVLNYVVGDASLPPWGLLDAAVQVKSGLDPAGAVLYARYPGGPLLRLPVADRAGVEALLATLGREGTPTQVGDRAGWRADDGVLVLHDGGLIGGADAATLAPFLRTGAPPASLADCPRGPGEADAFIRVRSAAGRACVTVRAEADRLLIEARGPGALLPARWFGDGDAGLIGRLGADATGLLAVHLTPAALAKATSLTPEAAPFAAALDGRVAVAVGPALGDATLLLGVADVARARAALAAGLPAGPKGPVVLSADGPDRWRVDLKNIKKIEGLPAVSTAFVALEGDALRVTTRAAAPAGRPGLVGPGRLDAAHLQAPVVAWLNQAGGRPHDGSAVMDAIRPVLGADADGLLPWFVAGAWLAGRVGAAAVSVHQRADGLRVAVEVELL